MIPSTNTKLLVAEDWKKIYQSFRNADFQSYDFETLRRTMISYLEENYPEDFNDYIDSSEYIALIDVIAYLGQNLSFRIDLNARENFLETAQRRDSILRLAQLISYSPSRNTPASGFLKVTAISTTDNVIDSNGINLANTTISWNDPTNISWYQQFIGILNSAMSGSFVFGKPYDRNTIDGVLTEQYRIASANTDVSIYSFLSNIGGTSMNFEIVPATFSGQSYIYEEAPRPANTFSFIYQNDNQGSGSANTGFFTHFRQGSLSTSQFSIPAPVPNQIIGVNTPNINKTDVWLWQLDATGVYDNVWTKVPDIVGNNIIYNSLDKNIRNIYSVSSRDQDQIDLNFADGSFGNLPKGSFRLFYRQSNGLTYSIKPEQMSGVVVDVPYFNKSGQRQVLTMTMGLQYTVNNSSGPETNASIQNKAPQAYYTQNRMVTAEDYNIAPLTVGNDILKVKSVNRVSSGLSKYFDLSDISGKYSKTNIFANDGILYKKTYEQNFEFSSTNRNEIFSVIKQQLAPVIASAATRSFYFDLYPRPTLDYATPDTFYWKQVNKTSGQSRGYFYQGTGGVEIPQNVGVFSTSNLRHVEPGALIKFKPPAGKYFLPNGSVVSKISGKTLNYLWVKVVQVIGDGSNSGQGALDDGTGPIIFSNAIDSSSSPVEIIPKFISTFSYTFESALVNLCLNQRNFGLSFDKLYRKWNIISDSNLDLYRPFSLDLQNDTDNASRDASWLVSFTWTEKSYNVRYRSIDYIFESAAETAFFVDPNSINYDFVNDTVIKDRIDVLSINTAVQPLLAASTATVGSVGKDYQWQIDNAIIEADGYTEPKKVKVSFYDYNNAGQISDPDAFVNIVEPLTTSTVTGFLDKFVYFQKASGTTGYSLVDGEQFSAYPTPDDVPRAVMELAQSGDLYYFYDPAYNVINSYSTGVTTWVYEDNYVAYPGRDTLKFHYVHNSGEDKRIDPSKSNIIDVYLLTATYDTNYRNWLLTGSGLEPASPTSQGLEQNYSALLEPIKTISDEMVFQPVKYKVLFGSRAAPSLQATFKAVRNSSRPVSDNDLKTRILDAIQNFFTLENWDFGQSFYFSELSTYVMNLLTPDITNFIIVPKTSNNFGSLYEIACLSNEIFINGATVSDIEIIDAITASQLKTSSIVTTANGTGNGGQYGY
jgi:hypothetical protein